MTPIGQALAQENPSGRLHTQLTGKFLLPALVLTEHGDRLDAEVHFTSPVVVQRFCQFKWKGKMSV